MIKKYLILFSSLFLISLYFSCSSGKKAFERGNYDEGLFKAISRLRQSPNNKRAIETLRYGYPITLQWHQDNIKRIQQVNDNFVQENMYYEYKKMNQINDEIRRCPSCLNIIQNPKSFVAEQAAAVQKAAANRYQIGEGLLQESIAQYDKGKAMDAYYNFEIANGLMPGYQDATDKMEKAKWQATTKVVIEEIATGSAMLDISADFFYNKIQSFLVQMQVSPFVRFYTPKEAKSYSIETPDQIVKLKFDYFTVGQVYHKVTEEVRKKDSVIIGSVKDSNGKKLNVYGTVNAKLIINHKELISKGLLDLKIIDPYSSRVLSQEKLPGEYIWVSEWGNFNGDEKALNKSDWKIIKATEVPPPSPQNLFIAFTQPIFDQATAKLNNYYSAYR